jgi:hypothetical protein
MPSFGDYVGYQNLYSNKTTDGALTSGGTVTVVPKSAKHTLYIQKITVNILTHANAKTIIGGDGTITISTINDLTAAAGVPDQVIHDFGPKGRALTVGATFTLTSAASGPVADVHIECYEKLTTPVSYLAGASLQ